MTKISATHIRFGQRIRIMRLKLGMSVEEVAKKSGLLKSQILSIEHGNHKSCEKHFIESIANCFGVNYFLLTAHLPGGSKFKQDQQEDKLIEHQVKNNLIKKGVIEFEIDGKIYQARTYENALRKHKSKNHDTI